MQHPRNITKTQMFTEMTSRWAPFPNRQSYLGAYDYFSQTIALPSVSADQFAAAYRDNNFNARLEVAPLLVHELQHFADNISSVWGRSLLVRLFNVYTTRTSDSLDDYWRIPEMMRELKTIHFNDYYTDYTDAAFEPSDGSPWEYNLSTGFQLDSRGHLREDRPILFTRFTRAGIDPYICRVPMSVASLLEVRAIAAELITAIALFNEAGEDPVKLIDRKNWGDKMSEIAYDPLMTVYTVAAHYFTNVLHTKEFVATYVGAAIVAWVCLNLPRQLFEGLAVPETFSSWKDHWGAYLANSDRGFLYACLIENGRGLDTSNMTQWLDQALQQSNLPPLEALRIMIDKERREVVKEAVEGPYHNRLQDLLDAGMEYIKRERCETGFHYMFPGGPMPPFLLKENIFLRPKPLLRGDTFKEPVKWFEEAFRLENRIREFVDACIV